MGIFDKITRGITRGIGNAVSKATQKAVERKATEILTPKIKQAADTIAGSTSQSSQTAHTSSGNTVGELEDSLNSLGTAMGSYATKVASNLKVCASCGASASADKKFCPECGNPLPEKTVSQSCVCPECGKQNSLNEKFCGDCGTKLPITAEGEQRQKNADMEVIQSWDDKLSVYPKWKFGGTNYYIEEYGSNAYVFGVTFKGYDQAYEAVQCYKELLKQNGFTPAGQYPSEGQLYKIVNGVCYHVDVENCFEGDAQSPSIGFNIGEPNGGFYYEEKPKKKKGLFGLFG